MEELRKTGSLIRHAQKMLKQDHAEKHVTSSKDAFSQVFRVRLLDSQAHHRETEWRPLIFLSWMMEILYLIKHLLNKNNCKCIFSGKLAYLTLKVTELLPQSQGHSHLFSFISFHNIIFIYFNGHCI